MPDWLKVLVCVGVCLLTGRAAFAQDSRAAEIAGAQAEKAQALSPPVLSRGQRIMLKIEGTGADGKWPTPALYSIYAGGGFTPGARLKRHYGDKALWQVTGLYSFKQYKLAEFYTESPGHATGRIDLTARAGWRDATQVGFYGLGPDTIRSDRANYRFQQTFTEGTIVFRPIHWLPLTGRLGVDDYNLKSGKGDEPSIETIYTPDTAPGLGESATYIHSEVQAAVDTRPSIGYTRSGGFYGVTLHNYADTGDALSFKRVDATAIHHIPILRETWVLSLRASVQTIVGEDSTVPYFLLPPLGGGRTLRAFDSWRFRDRHSLLTQIEWRWLPNRLLLDMAIFLDAGKVEPRRENLNLHNMASNMGVGARFHGPRDAVMRVELAKGAEGFILVFSSIAAF